MAAVKLQKKKLEVKYNLFVPLFDQRIWVDLQLSHKCVSFIIDIFNLQNRIYSF